MKKAKLVMIFFIIGSVFLSCASFPDANEKNRTLIIGQIVLEAKGWPTDNISINGIYKTGIQITIQDNASGKTYSIKSQNDGMFYSVNVPNGNYKITRIYFKKTSGRSWRDVWIEPGRSQFVIKEGYVNNLGLFNWLSEPSKSLLLNNKEYEQVKNLFQEEYVSSNWNEKDWIETNIKG